MLNAEVRPILADIVRQNGVAITANPVGLQEALRALAAPYARENGMIINAVRAGVPEEIRQAGTGIDGRKIAIVARLEGEYSFPYDVAEWVVETWIFALSNVGQPTAPPMATAPPAPSGLPPVDQGPTVATTLPPVAPTLPPITVGPPAATLPPVAVAGPPLVSPGPPVNQVFGQPYQNPGPKPPMNPGKVVTIVVAVFVVVVGLSVGGYFLFRAKPATTTITIGMTPGATGQTAPVGGGQLTAGGYSPVMEPDQQNHTTGTLTLSADNTFIMDFAMNAQGQAKSLEARGKWTPDGALTLDQITVNGKTTDSPPFKCGLAPAGNRFLWTGDIADAVGRDANGAKVYWSK